VLRDASWYICHTDLTREYLFQRVTQLLDTLLPRLNEIWIGLLRSLIVLRLFYQSAWDPFVDRLETIEGEGVSMDSES
jgi:hypothetical protein